MLDGEPQNAVVKDKDYSALGDYNVLNYREQPHIYVDDENEQTKRMYTYYKKLTALI